LLHLKAWVDLVKVVRLVQVVRVRLVPVAQVALVVQLAHVRLVPAALRVQVSAVRAQLAQVLLRVVLQVSLVRAVAQLAAAAAVSVEELPAHSVRVAKATEPESQSAQSAKSMNRDKPRA
jgi:hypothetical protein